MLANELRTLLLDIYEKHEMNVEGEYNDRACTAACCYDRPERIDAAAEEIYALLRANTAEYFYFCNRGIYPGNYPGVEYIVSNFERHTCEHVMTLVGQSSNTSSGIKDRWECTKCGAVEYHASDLPFYIIRGVI